MEGDERKGAIDSLPSSSSSSSSLLRWWGLDDFNISVARLKKSPQGQSIGWRLINKDANLFENRSHAYGPQLDFVSLFPNSSYPIPVLIEMKGQVLRCPRLSRRLVTKSKNREKRWLSLFVGCVERWEYYLYLQWKKETEKKHLGGNLAIAKSRPGEEYMMHAGLSIALRQSASKSTIRFQSRT
jgi:hypothetical protein